MQGHDKRGVQAGYLGICDTADGRGVYQGQMEIRSALKQDARQERGLETDHYHRYR